MKPKHKKAFMQTAEVFANCSSSKRLKVGACVVKDDRIIGVGYNALPKHLDGSLEDDCNATKPEVRHAEKSALMGMLKVGISPIGAEMFVTHSCCKHCAIDIVDAGILKVTYKEEYRDKSGLQYLQSCGVIVEKYEGA